MNIIRFGQLALSSLILFQPVVFPSASLAQAPVPTLQLEAQPPGMSELSGPGAIAILMASHLAYLESGTLSSDLAAARAAGTPELHWASWAAAFRQALAADPSAPERLNALAMFSGYLSALEEHTELADSLVESASLESHASDRVWHLMLAIGAEGRAVASDMANDALARDFADLVDLAYQAHANATYPTDARRSELAWRLLGNLRGTTERMVASAISDSAEPSELRSVVLDRLAQAIDQGVALVIAECSESDRQQIRTLHAHLDGPLLVAAQISALNSDATALSARWNQIRNLPPADRQSSDAVLVSRLLSATGHADAMELQSVITSMLNALPDSVEAEELRIQAVQDGVVSESDAIAMLEQSANRLISMPPSDADFALARRMLVNCASTLALRCDALNQHAQAAHWRSVASEAMTNTPPPGLN